MAVSVNSTREKPGGKSALPAMPHDTTTRCGGSTSRYLPRNGTPLMSTANRPPATGSRSARSPIHVTMRSASTRWANTTSGGASMTIDVEKSTIRAGPPDFGFCGLLQGGEMARPEAVEEVAHSLQTVGAHDEEVARPLVVLGDQTGAAQHAQVKRNRLLRHGDLFGDVADGARFVAHQVEDAAAVGVGQGTQGDVEGVWRGGTGHRRIQTHTCTSVNWNIALKWRTAYPRWTMTTPADNQPWLHQTGE